MTRNANAPHNWSRDSQADLDSVPRQIIHTTWEVVRGGVIRAGKTSYADDAHAGFWLGTGADGIVRLNLGGPDHGLRWTGDRLSVRGWLLTPTVAIDDDGLTIIQGDDISNQLRFVTGDGDTVGLMEVTCDFGPWMVLETPQPADVGDTGRLDLQVDGDLGANVRLRLETTKGGGPLSARAQVMVGNQAKLTVDAAGLTTATGGFDATGGRVRRVADAMANDDALNRGAGDARYVARAGGWTGVIPIGALTITVVDGQIVAVT